MRDETCANKPVLNEPTIIRRGKTQIDKLIARYWAQVLVVAMALLLWVPRLSGPIDLRWDAGVYYVLGRSLATGHGYRILSEPGSPEALQYPPLLPLIVAAHQRVMGTSDYINDLRGVLAQQYPADVVCYAVSSLRVGRTRSREEIPAGGVCGDGSGAISAPGQHYLSLRCAVH